MTADLVVELRKIAFANMADYIKSTLEGGVVLDFAGLTRDQTAALSQVKISGDSVTFKLHDKRAALVDLGRYLGLFDAKRKQQDIITVEADFRMSEIRYSAHWLACQPPEYQRAVVKSLTPEQLQRWQSSWIQWIARDEQIPPPGDWRTWLYSPAAVPGRPAAEPNGSTSRSEPGGAKSRWSPRRQPMCAMSWSKERAASWRYLYPGSGRTYEPSKRRLTWPNGAIATTYSADEPERLRGPQHDCAWCDEMGAWRYAEAWDMLMFGLRLGTEARVMVTTTPRPTRLLRNLVADPTTAITRGSTYANRANLAGAFLDQIVKKYEGTRLGRQELNAELLDDVPGALWTRALIEAARPPMQGPCRTTKPPDSSSRPARSTGS